MSLIITKSDKHVIEGFVDTAAEIESLSTKGFALGSTVLTIDTCDVYVLTKDGWKRLGGA